MKVQLAPSILSADFAALGDAVALAERAGADFIHVDVMDGHFVPNITIGPPVVKALKRVAKVPLDCHLMISDPDRYIDAFAAAGAAWISVHVEVLPHLHRTLQAIKALGVKAGAVLNPSTPVVAIENVATDVDFVVVMSVNPGFGGQTFIPATYAKLVDLKNRLGERPLDVSVDGGVKLEHCRPLALRGATTLVAGSGIFATGDPAAEVRRFRAAALSAATA